MFVQMEKQKYIDEIQKKNSPEKKASFKDPWVNGKSFLRNKKMHRFAYSLQIQT